MKEEEEVRVCRICFDEEKERNKLISPCRCRGSSKFIHESCLSTWILSQEGAASEKNCEVCKFMYKIKVSKGFVFNPCQAVSSNYYFLGYICALIMITILLVILLYEIVNKGYVNPRKNIYYFVGVVVLFTLALSFDIIMLVKLTFNILFVKTNKMVKILPISESDISYTTIINTLQRVDSQQAGEFTNRSEEPLRVSEL